MSLKSNGEDELWTRLIKFVDHLLIPMAAGVCSLVATTQLICTIPMVRTAVDQMSDRFVAVSSTQSETTPVHLNLYIAPAQSRPDIQVLVNGMLRTTFYKPNIGLDVYPNDTITLVTQSNREADITFDTDTANLMYPIPGYTVTLGTTFHVITLDKIRILS